MPSLTIANDNVTTTVNLDTIVNIADWIAWQDNLTGNITTNDGVRRTGGGAIIGAPSNIMWVPANTAFLMNNPLIKKSLTYNGTAIGTPPEGTNVTTSTGIYTQLNNETMQWTFPVDGAGVTTIYLFVGCFLSGAGTLSASVSDASSSPVSLASSGGDNPDNYVLMCQASGAATVTATWTNNGTNFSYVSAVALTTSVAAGPSITVQPQSVSTYVGNTATFNVTATGTGTLHYQWKKNGSNVGTDSSSYTTPTLTMADNGAVYTVVVTDDNGSVTSNGALLTVYIVAAVAWIKA